MTYLYLHDVLVVVDVPICFVKAFALAPDGKPVQVVIVLQISLNDKNP